MSHALATVRHDGRRPSVTPGKRQGAIYQAAKRRQIFSLGRESTERFERLEVER
jgi:hypothetical protein